MRVKKTYEEILAERRLSLAEAWRNVLARSAERAARQRREAALDQVRRTAFTDLDLAVGP